MTKAFWAIFLGAVLLTGCMGGAQLVLKSPVQSKCEELKLRGCEQLAEGIVLYVDGDKARGTSALRASLARNTDDPQKLKDLATGLKLLQKAPGLGSYVAMLRPLVDLIDEAANQPPAPAGHDEERTPSQPVVLAKAPATPADGPSEPSEPRPRGANRSGVGAVRTGTLLAHRGTPGEACSLLGGMPGILPASQAQCLLAVTGPFVVTDLHSAGGCPQDLVVLAGDPERPSWFVYVPAGKPLDLHGARLAVGREAPLTMALLSPSSAPSPLCAVTWSGTRE